MLRGKERPHEAEPDQIMAKRRMDLKDWCLIYQMSGHNLELPEIAAREPLPLLEDEPPVSRNMRSSQRRHVLPLSISGPFNKGPSCLRRQWL